MNPIISQMKILVLNENEMLRKVIEKTLVLDGHQVNSTKDGLEAYSLIESDSPDLVVIDLIISYITGYELIEYIRSLSGKYIKIIILSRVRLDSVINDSFDLGVDDYMTVPVQPKELLGRINRLSRYSIAG